MSPELPAGVEVTRVVANGMHCAFTSLILWRGHYYLAYREAHGHGIIPPGHLVILRSADAITWEPCATIATGGDDRDPRFFTTPDALGLVFGTWYRAWMPETTIASTTHHLVSHIALSSDGQHWGTPFQTYRPNYWLWSILAMGDEDEPSYYAAAYHFGGFENHEHSIHLLHSADLVIWHERECLVVGREVSEPVLYALPDEKLGCLIRKDGRQAYRGEAQLPYTKWALEPLGSEELHIAAVLPHADGWIVAARQVERTERQAVWRDKGGRAIPERRQQTRWRCALYRLDASGTLTHLVTLPSGGDCAYPGLAPGAHSDEIIVSFYSQHERHKRTSGLLPDAADIYIARVDLNAFENSSL